MNLKTALFQRSRRPASPLGRFILRTSRNASLCLLLFAGPATAANTTVAVASNFMWTMEALVRDFEQQTGHRVTVVAGSSGKLYAQILAGAPFDAFLSADQQKPASLLSSRRGIEGSGFTYARGALALWSPTGKDGLSAEQTLKQLRFRHLAIANPKLAPYGVAAQSALARLALDKAIASKLVYGENIAQAFQFVATGNAQLGLVSYAQLLQYRQRPEQESDIVGQFWLLPQSLYAPIRQDAILLARGSNNEAARALLSYLRSDAARGLINRHGYQVEAGT